MKDLRESPTGYHIMLEHDVAQDGVSVVMFTLQGTSGEITVTPAEARTIAAWFAGLAAELEASEEVGNGDT